MHAVVPAERFLGCLLGQAIGDGLGAPYEGLPPGHISWMCGWASEIVANRSQETLSYTDDTQMMIGVAETLVAHGEIVEDALCRRFAAN